MKRSVYILFILCFACMANSCKSSKKAATPETAIENQVIIQVKSNVSTKRVIASFEAYKLEVLEAINERMNLWVFTYDTTLIESEELLEKLRASPSVVSAEMNKKVELR